MTKKNSSCVGSEKSRSAHSDCPYVSSGSGAKYTISRMIMTPSAAEASANDIAR